MKEQKKQKFLIRMQKKLLWLYALIIIAFAGLSIRLFWIVKEDGTKYQKQVLAQQRYDSTTLPFRRGDIVDAKGTKLAVSEKVALGIEPGTDSRSSGGERSGLGRFQYTGKIS